MASDKISLDRVGLAIALFGIGISMCLTGISETVTYMNRYRAIQSYARMLQNEIKVNRLQAESVLNQHEKGLPLTLIPNYRSDVYKAGLGTDGYLYALDLDSQLLTLLSDALASTDEKTIELYKNDPQKHSDAIYGQALGVQAFLGTLNPQAKVRVEYKFPIIIAILFTLFGLLIIRQSTRFLGTSSKRRRFSSIRARLGNRRK